MRIGALDNSGYDLPRLRYTRRIILWILLLCIVGITPLYVLCAQSRDDSSLQHFLRAERAYSREDWKVAVEEYKEVIQSDPRNDVALVHLGIADQKLGMLDEAEKSFERALQLKPGLAEVDILLGLVCIELGKYREAIVPLEGAFGKSDYDVPARSAAGQRLVEIYFSLGHQEKALDTVQRLRELAPDDPDVLYTASKVYASLWNQAVQRLLAKSPNSYRIHQVLAEVAEAQGNYSEAAKEYRLIVKMAPGLPEFHYRLGRTILESETTPEAGQNALQEFQKELQLNPRDARADEQIGELYLAAHENEQSTQYFSRAIQLDPDHSEARIGLAKVLLAEKLYQKAVDQLEKAVELSPNDETAYYNLMAAYRGLGRTADARRAMEDFQRLTRQKEQQHSSIMQQLKGVLGDTQSKGP